MPASSPTTVAAGKIKAISLYFATCAHTFSFSGGFFSAVSFASLLRIVIPLLGCSLVAFNQIADAPGIGLAVSVAGNRVRTTGGIYAYIGPEHSSGNLH